MWVLVVCRCCALFGVGVDCSVMVRVCRICGVPFGKYPVRQVCEGCGIVRRALSTVAGSRSRFASSFGDMSPSPLVAVVCACTAKNAGKLAPALSAFVGALGALGFSWLLVLVVVA